MIYYEVEIYKEGNLYYKFKTDNAEEANDLIQKEIDKGNAPKLIQRETI